MKSTSSQNTARVLACALLLLIASAAALHAQAGIVLRGRGDIENDAFLRAFLARGNFTLIGEDRSVAANDTLRGDVIVADATLRLDGVITGDLVIVDGSVHLRPSARVLGGVRNIAGGFYRSELAQIDGPVRSEPEAPYDAAKNSDGMVVITGTEQRRPIAPIFLAPTYDRVNGVTARAGAALLLPRLGAVEPVVRGRVEYVSARGDWIGGAELGIARRRTEVAVGAERTTATNERWIRGDMTNSLGAILTGKDYRDYYAVDRAYTEVGRLLENGPRVTNAYLRAQVEDARPLRAGTPWSVFGDFRQDNIEFTVSRITSAILGADTEWTMPQHVIVIDALTEFGLDLFDSHHSFQRYYIDADWAMAALRDHTLGIELHFQGPLPGTDSLPGQRWSFVGGSSTLNTFEVAEFRGDRVAWAETRYSIPIPRLRIRSLDVLGVPSVDLLHLVGMAWSRDVARGFEQNVGLRLSYDLVFARVLSNPDDLTGDAEFSIGVTLPKRKYPWQQPRD
ncbi:MAG TPA: hypothetical protein VMN60_05520 [Longimicrobiales bacterium]|nr:hypothetical protein [Longimicrobiales bacterium]